MTEQEIAISILLVGLTVVLAILIKFGFRALSLPAITGYFLLGFLIKTVGGQLNLLTPFSLQILGFMGSLGIVALLFRIGLESKLAELVRWLPKAFMVWTGDVLFCIVLAFAAAYWLLDLDLIPSMFIAAALTPTSVGISVAVWEELKVLNSKEGKVMLDTAELDDLSGILLMGILFALAPVLQGESAVGGSGITALVAETTGMFLLKILLFGAFCYLFARFAEQKISRLLNRLHAGDSAMLVVAGIGLIVAALAAFFGFSVAIGAFFAGLIFSSDPASVKIDASYEALYELFVPFFFVSIGMSIDPAALQGAGLPVLLLLAAAVAGKMLGAGLPAAVTLGGSAGVLIGLSMIPRAEISLIILQRGQSLGDWAVSPEVFLWGVLISGTTAVLMPIVLRRVLKSNIPKTEPA